MLFSTSTVLTLLAGLTLADLPPGYQSLSATNKLSILWNRISAHPFDQANLPVNEPSYLDQANLLVPSFGAVSFSHVSDDLPADRIKLIHPIGSTAKVALKIYPNSSYSGVFQSGGIGVARLSLTRQDYTNYSPGLGLKILIDGQPSQNLLVMFSLDGQGTNKNFFANIFTNVIPSATSGLLQAIESAFNQALAYLPGSVTWDRPEEAVNLGLYEHAAVLANGTAVEDVRAPYVVCFKPNPVVGWSPDDTRDFRSHLHAIASGSKLYTVYAKQSLDGPEEMIGELVTTSGFVASFYQDQRLFFQHAAKRWRLPV